MNIATVKYNDIANGDGVRISIFVSGCRNHCLNCFNKELWDFDYGSTYTSDIENDIITHLSHSYISGISLLGGDPLEPENKSMLTNLCKKVKKQFPTKTIWCYTGYLFKDIENEELIKYVDVLVDGKFIDSLKNISLKFKGSSNQRIIDVAQSLKQNKIILKDYKDNE